MKSIAQITIITCLILFSSLSIAKSTHSMELVLKDIAPYLGFVVKPGAEVDSKLHSHFWNMLAEKQYMSKETLGFINGFINVQMINAKKYENAMWRSALLSFEAKQVKYTNDFEEVESKAIDPFTMANLMSTKGTEDYDIIVDTSKLALNGVKLNTHSLINSAATGEALTLEGESPTFITKELLLRMIGVTSTSVTNLNKLISPTWK